jgi:hypothetical protein
MKTYQSFIGDIGMKQLMMVHESVYVEYTKYTESALINQKNLSVRDEHISSKANK